MVEFFCPILKHFLYKLPSWVPFCPDGVWFCPENHQQPLFFTQPSLNPFWDMYEHETPAALPQNTPFPGLIFESRQNELLCYSAVWAKWTPSGQNDWKAGKTFLEVGKKKNYSWCRERKFYSLHDKHGNAGIMGRTIGWWFSIQHADFI